MTTPDGDNGTIRFSTKEMLLKLEAKLETIDLKLDRKVDRDDFQKIAMRVEAAADRAAVLALDVRLSKLEQHIELQDKVNEAIQRQAAEVSETAATNFTRREKMVGIVASLVALFILVYNFLHGIGVA